MTNETVNVRVSKDHFKSTIPVAGTEVTDKEFTEVEATDLVRSYVNRGVFILEEQEQFPEPSNETSGGDDTDGEEDKGDVGQDTESEKEQDEAEEVEKYSEEELREKNKDELKDLCEEHDLKKSGNKDDLVERLKNEEKE